MTICICYSLKFRFNDIFVKLINILFNKFRFNEFFVKLTNILFNGVYISNL